MSSLAARVDERTCASVLAAARKHVAALDARVLLQHVLGCAAAALIAHPEQVLTSEQHARYRALLQRRAQGEPIAHLTSEREFYGRPFRVTPDVLIPRPETELLVELALAHISADSVGDVLDLGTGSGCVALSIAAERPRMHVIAADVSAAALDVAKANARSLAVSNVSFVLSDWFAALGGRRFSLIVANPPYVADADPHLARGDVRFEPRLALCAGSDGLDALRAIIATSRKRLEPGGWIFLEHGYDQAQAVRALLLANGYVDVASYRDLSDVERVTGGRRCPIN